MSCGCGKNKKRAQQTFEHVSADGSVIKTYDSEVDAMMAAASQSGTRVRPAQTVTA